jgi:folate-binding protein YgfZ
MTVSLGPADLLLLTGGDAAHFAHAQFTSDVNSLAAGTWQWSAWLDAQGRARHFFALMRIDPSNLAAWLPLGGAAAMRDGLSRFIFRSAVKLDVPENWALHGLDAVDLAGPLVPGQVASYEGGYAVALPGPSRRLAGIAPAGSAPTTPAALDHWRLDDIAAGLPLLAPQLGGEFVPQALDLERLDAIRFDKGCYPGQEIAARLHFRGGNKRELRRLRVHGTAPAAGATLFDGDGAKVGQVLYGAVDSASTSAALAVLSQAVPSQSARQELLTSSGDHAEINANQSFEQWIK